MSLRESGVSLACSVIEQDLVIAKVITRVEHKVFAFLLIFQRQDYLPLEDHVKFSEMLAFFDNFLISQENVTVQVANEVADEFVSGICTFIAKYVHELSSE